MRKITIPIDSEKSLYLERLNFELSFTKDIIQRIIESHPNDPELINGATFKAYQKQGAELQAEYSLASNEIEELYIPEKLKGHQYTWLIPNNANYMDITILCDCDIDGIE